jgi:hypothetical protein
MGRNKTNYTAYYWAHTAVCAINFIAAIIAFTFYWHTNTVYDLLAVDAMPAKFDIYKTMVLVQLYTAFIWVLTVFSTAFIFFTPDKRRNKVLSVTTMTISLTYVMIIYTHDMTLLDKGKIFSKRNSSECKSITRCKRQV